MTALKSNNPSLAQRWGAYGPSKRVWLWSIVCSSALTLLVGFTAGGWMTSGGATVMATVAADQARAELAASLCVDRFVSADLAAANLKELKGASFWQRDKFILDGGWADIAGQGPVPGAVGLCAKQLLAMKQLPISNVSETSAGG